MLRQDYVGRLIQQVAEALARASGCVRERRLEQAEKEILGAEAALGSSGMDRIDARSVASILGGGDKVVLAAALLAERAELASAAGDAVSAARFRERARALLEHSTPRELAEMAAEIRGRLEGGA